MHPWKWPETSRIWCLIISWSQCKFAIGFSCTLMGFQIRLWLTACGRLSSDTKFSPLAVSNFFLAKSGKSWELTLTDCCIVLASFIHFANYWQNQYLLRKLIIHAWSFCLHHTCIVHTPYWLVTRSPKSNTTQRTLLPCIFAFLHFCNDSIGWVTATACSLHLVQAPIRKNLMEGTTCKVWQTANSKMHFTIPLSAVPCIRHTAERKSLCANKQCLENHLKVHPCKLRFTYITS